MPLNKKQKEAIRLMIYQHLKQSEISKQINIDESTFSRWWHNAEFCKEYDEEFRISSKSLIDEAQATILNLMQNAQSETVKLRAAQDILSRNGLDAAQKIEQVGDTTVKVTIEDE